MSLEQTIQENTAALNALAEAVRALASGQAAGGSANTVGATGGNVSKAAAGKTKGNAKVEPETKADPEPALVKDDVADAEEVTVSKTEAKAEPVTYDACATAITKLSKGKGRAVAVELLASFDLKTLQDAKDDAEKLAAVKAAADVALGA